MKRYSQRSGHTAMAELNVTPLLDLAFVLLIIFIITTPLLTSNIPVQLPTGSRNNNQPLDPKSVRTVSIDGTGRFGRAYYYCHRAARGDSGDVRLQLPGCHDSRHDGGTR